MQKLRNYQGTDPGSVWVAGTEGYALWDMNDSGDAIIQGREKHLSVIKLQIAQGVCREGGERGLAVYAYGSETDVSMIYGSHIIHDIILKCLLLHMT